MKISQKSTTQSPSTHWSVCLSWYGLAVTAIVAVVAVTWQVTGFGPSSSQIAARYDLVPMAELLLSPERKENMAFLAGLTAGMVSLWACAIGSQRWPLSREVSRGLAVIGLACVVFVLNRIDWASGLPPIYSDLITFAALQPWSFCGLTILIGVVLFLAPNRFRVALCGVAGVASAFYLASLVFVTYHDPIIQNLHFEVFYYPIVQSYLGVPVGVEQPSQYGLYPILLSPLWWVLTPTPFVVSAVMATLFVGTMIAFGVFLAHFSKNPALGIAIVALGVVISLLWFPFWPGDRYFQMFPLRLVFPAIAMVMCIVSSTSERSLAASYFVLGTGLIWAIDGGVIALGLFAAFACARELGQRPFIRIVVRHALCAATGIGAALLVILAYFLVHAGAFPSVELLTFHIQVFSSGLVALPMPPWGVWIVPVVVYSASLFIGVRGLYAEPPRSLAQRDRDAALIAMAVFGVLLFRYYQGRSHLLILGFVSFPAVFCIGLLLDRLFRSFGQPGGDAPARYVVAGLFAPLLAALVFHAAHFSTLSRPWLLPILINWASPLETKITVINSEFAKIRRSPDDAMLVLAPYAAAMMLASRKPSPLFIDGICQIWRNKDRADANRFLESKNTRMVIFDADPSGSCSPAVPVPIGYPGSETSRLTSQGFVPLHMPDVVNQERYLKVYVRP